MAWRLAYSLEQLRKEANAVAPQRSKAADGTIGDEAHASRASSHNPNNAGVVCALDLTHDPAHGMDTYSLFDYLRTHPHPDLRYVISNRRIAKRTNGWRPEKYTGSNPHTGHIHVAVGRGTDSEPTPPYDTTTSWGLAQWAKPPAKYKSPAEMMDVEWLKPHKSPITGAMIQQAWRDYGIPPHILLSIMGAETSLGDPVLGGELARRYNFGCIKVNKNLRTKWGELAHDAFVAKDAIWFAFPDAITGLRALCRLLKVGPMSDPGYYLRCFAKEDWAPEFAAKYNSGDGTEYVETLRALDAKFKRVARENGWVW